MFFLKTGESLDIKIDSFNKSLKPLLSRHRIVNQKLSNYLPINTKFLLGYKEFYNKTTASKNYLYRRN